MMAAVFDTLPCFEPDWTEEQKNDQLSWLDKIKEDGTMTKAMAAAAWTKLADTFDWLPQSLKDMIDGYSPKSEDIENGIVNKTKLTQAAEELFGKKMKAMKFVNFYQLKAAVLRFGGLWDFLVTVDSGTFENGGLALKQKESISFWWFLAHRNDFAIKMLQTSFPELKKHRPTNLYMLYLMAQSIVFVCVEIDKKMPPQWHCPLSSSSWWKTKSFWHAGLLQTKSE
jgi:hypothetical protein